MHGSSASIHIRVNTYIAQQHPFELYIGVSGVSGETCDLATRSALLALPLRGQYDVLNQTMGSYVWAQLAVHQTARRRALKV